MSSKVEPREVAALLGEAGAPSPPPPSVEPCDFRRPRRLSPAQRDELRAALVARVPAVEGELAEALGTRPTLELVGLSEAHADTLFDGVPEPLLALRFRTNGQPGWLLWESLAALQCVERILGGSVATKAARRLSPVEAGVLQGLLEALARPLLKGLSLTLSEPDVVQDRISLGSWRDGGKAADPHRLGIELGLEGLGSPTSVHLFLAGFQEGLTRPAAAPARPEVLAAVPPSLQHVEVELRVLLAGALIPLAQLLSLEQGDVIPLAAAAGDPVRALVNGRPIAKGSWGKHAGRLAMRIDELESEKETRR